MCAILERRLPRGRPGFVDPGRSGRIRTGCRKKRGVPRGAEARSLRGGAACGVRQRRTRHDAGALQNEIAGTAIPWRTGNRASIRKKRSRFPDRRMRPPQAWGDRRKGLATARARWPVNMKPDYAMRFWSTSFRRLVTCFPCSRFASHNQAGLCLPATSPHRTRHPGRTELREGRLQSGAWRTCCLSQQV